MKRVAVKERLPNLAGGYAGELVLVILAILFVGQITRGLGGLASRALYWLGSVALVIDVRNWQWTWSARAQGLNLLRAAVSLFDVRGWSWVVYAIISVAAIVALVGFKAWRDR